MDANSSSSSSLILTTEISFTFIIPLLTIFPIVLNFTTAYIFEMNIEFKTQMYRYLKLNSIIDALSLMTILPFPLTECQQLCRGWWSSNYWLLVYQIYVNLYISRALRTISSLLSVTIAWNRYVTMNTFKLTTNNFYLLVPLNFLLSFALYLPNLVFNEIVYVNETRYERVSKKIFGVDTFNVISLCHYIVSLLILMITVGLNIKLVLKIREKINSKFRSIRYTQKTVIKYENKSIKMFSTKDSSSCSSSLDMNSLLQLERINMYKLIFSRTRVIELDTTLLIVWITLIFIIDQFLQSVGATLFIFIDQHSTTFTLVLVFLFLIIIVTQLLNFFIYYKFNKAFKRRFKQIFVSTCPMSP